MTIAPDFFDTEQRNWRARLAVSVAVMRELSQYSDPQETALPAIPRHAIQPLDRPRQPVEGVASSPRP
jgi:hypothetical protein